MHVSNRLATGTTRTITTTTLRVSELHVPGYSQSKLSFLLPTREDDLGSRISPSTPPETLAFIPFQDGYLLHKSLQPILTPAECQKIIDEAEDIATKDIPWTTARHGNFPTTDMPIVELPQTLHFVQHVLVERIYPALRQKFGCYLPDPNRLCVVDGFVVRYDATNGPKELQPHRDGSVLSFNVALNPSNEYQGGGTWFASCPKGESMVGTAGERQR